MGKMKMGLSITVYSPADEAIQTGQWGRIDMREWCQHEADRINAKPGKAFVVEVDENKRGEVACIRRFVTK